jgi:hypothetical protein
MSAGGCSVVSFALLTWRVPCELSSGLISRCRRLAAVSDFEAVRNRSSVSGFGSPVAGIRVCSGSINGAAGDVPRLSLLPGSTLTTLQAELGRIILEWEVSEVPAKLLS